jgi:hypothetical protein
MDAVFSFGLGLFSYTVAPILVLAFVVKTFHWTTGPILRAAREVKSPRSFLLSDLIWLLIQIQMAMAVAGAAFPATMPARERVWALLLLSGAMVLFWLAGLQAVSQAGIKRPLRRAVVFVVLMPGLALATLGVPLFAMGFLYALAEQDRGGLPGHGAWLLGGELLLLIALSVSLGWLARWTVSDS